VNERERHAFNSPPPPTHIHTHPNTQTHSHDMPVLKALTPSSANMKGGTSLVLTGANFGAVDGSLEAYLGGTPCDSLS